MLQGLATDLTVQPDAGEGPVRLDSLLRDREGFSSLLDRQSTEVSQLNDTRLAGIQFFQTFESRMDCQQFIRLMFGNDNRLLKIDLLMQAAVSRGAPPPRLIDQEVAHDSGCESDEVGSPFPGNF